MKKVERVLKRKICALVNDDLSAVLICAQAEEQQTFDSN